MNPYQVLRSFQKRKMSLYIWSLALYLVGLAAKHLWKKWIAKKDVLKQNASISKDEGPRFLESLLDQPFYSTLEGFEVRERSQNPGFRKPMCDIKIQSPVFIDLQASVFRLEHQLYPQRLTQHQPNMFSPSGWQQVPRDWFGLASVASPLPSPRAYGICWSPVKEDRMSNWHLEEMYCCTAYTSILWRKVNSSSLICSFHKSLFEVANKPWPNITHP